MDVLAVSGLVKRFGGTRVIEDLTFSVPEHSVYGFVGSNGAGKTTTMKMILGLLKPDAGGITVCGEPVRFGGTQTNRHVGYLQDVPEFYNFMRAREYLRLCGDITGLKAAEITSRSHELLGLVGLKGAGKKIGTFSRGMKQRLGIAQALLNRPRLLICDEPTSSLDPVGRKEILDFLRVASTQATVLFSTHILADVERICDQVAVLNKGRIALEGTLAELKASHRASGFSIEFGPGADKAVVLGLLEKGGVTPLGVSDNEAAIEDLFLEAVK
jgi:ABC-2 type transport system ATP-binding protein